MNKLNFDIGYIRLDSNKTSDATSFSILLLLRTRFLRRWKYLFPDALQSSLVDVQKPHLIGIHVSEKKTGLRKNGWMGDLPDHLQREEHSRITQHEIGSPRLRSELALPTRLPSSIRQANVPEECLSYLGWQHQSHLMDA
jgi:hypothetical protein